jgi:hypothetical protein
MNNKRKMKKKKKDYSNPILIFMEKKKKKSGSNLSVGVFRGFLLRQEIQGKSPNQVIGEQVASSQIVLGRVGGGSPPRTSPKLIHKHNYQKPNPSPHTSCSPLVVYKYPFKPRHGCS